MEKVSNIFSKVGKILLSLIEALVILYVIGVTSIILFRNKFGYTQYGNVTLVTINEVNHHYLQDSDIGTLLTIKNQGEIEKGDLIYYYDVRDEAYVVKNGVVKDYIRGEDSSIYTLEGEGNVSVASTKVIGKYVNKKKNLGFIIDILVSRFGFLLLVLLPIMIIFIYQIYEFFIVYKYGKLEIENEERNEEQEKNKIKEEVKTEEIVTKETVTEIENKNTNSEENITPVSTIQKNEEIKETDSKTLNESNNTHDVNIQQQDDDDIELL